jgi:multiple antibiotic resistance protein
MSFLPSYFITAFVSIFVTLDAIGNIPVFLAMTPHSTQVERVKLVKRALVMVFVVLVSFALFGNLIFRLFGVTIEAFRIVAGLLLLKIAFDMMEARPDRVRHSPEELVSANREDIALIPLAIPMLSGPGTISSVIALTGQAAKAPSLVPAFLVLLVAILINVIIAFIALRSATAIAHFFKETGMRVFTRVMGLILAAIAVQFMLTGIKDAFHLS